MSRDADPRRHHVLRAGAQEKRAHQHPRDRDKHQGGDTAECLAHARVSSAAFSRHEGQMDGDEQQRDNGQH
jgi:hypothetical protein